MKGLHNFTPSNKFATAFYAFTIWQSHYRCWQIKKNAEKLIKFLFYDKIRGKKLDKCLINSQLKLCMLFLIGKSAL